MFQSHPFSLLLIVSALISMLTALLIWKYRAHPLAKCILVIFIGLFIWSSSYAAQWIFTNITAQIFCNKVAFLGVYITITAFLAFCIELTHRKSLNNIYTQVIHFGISALGVIIIFADDYLHLFYSSYYTRQIDGFVELFTEGSLGLYFWGIAYPNILFALSILLVFIQFFKAKQPYKSQIASVLLAASFMVLTVFITDAGYSPYPNLDLTPISLAFPSLVTMYTIVYGRLFDLVPFAHDTIFRDMADGILVIDSDNRIVDFNIAMRSISGKNITHGDAVEQVLDEWNELNAQLNSQSPGSIELYNADTQKTYDVRISRVKDQDAFSSGTLVVLRDITHRKNSQIQIQKFAEQLEEMNAVKDKFFSIIAHDLRSPLGSFKIMTEMMVDDATLFTEQERKTILNSMAKSSKHIYNLLDNLLTWANSQRGKIPFEPNYYDIADIVTECFGLLQAQAEAKNISLHSVVQPKSMALCDKEMITTVIRNLLANAIKFTQDGGKISVSAEKSSSGINVSIADSGVGMSDEVLQKLFRIDTNFTTKGTSQEKGTGLGLVLCREFVEKHGGTIWAESERGIGSTFTFFLPSGKAAERL